MPKSSHRELVRDIRLAHEKIGRSMDAVSHEGIVWHWDRSNWDKRAHPDQWMRDNRGASLSIGELARVAEKLKKTGVPKEIAEYLEHPNMAKLVEKAEERKRIDAEIERSLSMLEQNPLENRNEVKNILQLMKGAEKNVLDSHKEGLYEFAMERLSVAMGAMGILAKEKKRLQVTPEMDNAWLTMLALREHCRSAHNRHAIWAEYRSELKQIFKELAEHPEIATIGEIDPALFRSRHPLDFYAHSPNFVNSRISSKAEALVDSIK